jgi:hypothetical protein
MPWSANQVRARCRTATAVAGFLVGADFDVGEAGVVVEDGVQVGGAAECSAGGTAEAGAVRGGDGVLLALLPR